MTEIGPPLGAATRSVHFASPTISKDESLRGFLEKSTIPSTDSSSSVASMEELSSPSSRNGQFVEDENTRQSATGPEEKVKKRGLVRKLKCLSSWHAKENDKDSHKTRRKCASASAITLDHSINSATLVLKSCMKVRTLEESLEDEPSCHKQKSVSFDKVFIRQHARTVGDNPSVSSGGPPIALGWAFAPKQEVMSLDEYESIRGPKRREEDLKLPGMVRRQMLCITWGVPESVLTRMEKDANMTRHNRRVSCSYTFLDRTEEVIETAWRRTKRFVRGASKKREQEWLCENARKYAMAKDCPAMGEQPRDCGDAACYSATISSIIDDYDDSQLDFGENE